MILDIRLSLLVSKRVLGELGSRVDPQNAAGECSAAPRVTHAWVGLSPSMDTSYHSHYFSPCSHRSDRLAPGQVASCAAGEGMADLCLSKCLPWSFLQPETMGRAAASSPVEPPDGDVSWSSLRPCILHFSAQPLLLQ